VAPQNASYVKKLGRRKYQNNEILVRTGKQTRLTRYETLAQQMNKRVMTG
jgi:hypothetical protein